MTKARRRLRKRLARTLRDRRFERAGRGYAEACAISRGPRWRPATSDWRRIDPQPDTVVVTVYGDLDLHRADQLGNLLVGVVDQARRSSSSTSPTSSLPVDSQGLGALMRGTRRFGAGKDRFRLVVPAPESAALFEITALDRVFRSTRRASRRSPARWGRGGRTTAEDRHLGAGRSGRSTRPRRCAPWWGRVSAGCGTGSTTGAGLQRRRGRASCRSCYSSARAARGRRAMEEPRRLGEGHPEGAAPRHGSGRRPVRLDVVRWFGIRKFPSLVLIVRRRVVGRLEGKATRNEDRLAPPDAPPGLNGRRGRGRTALRSGAARARTGARPARRAYGRWRRLAQPLTTVFRSGTRRAVRGAP